MKAISFGEILWDIIDNKEHLGGAPLNLSAHIAKLGDESWIVSAVGNDERGEKAMANLSEIGIKSEFINILDAYPTGYVTVNLDLEGKPTYKIHENVAWDNIYYDSNGDEYDVFCFGTLAQRNKVSRDTLFVLMDKIKANEIFFDVNLRQSYFSKEIIENSLKHATIIKMNDEEVIELSRMFYEEDLSEEDFSKKLSEEYNIKIVIITKGGDGCAIWYDNKFREYPGQKVVVADTVGAGDAFSAGFLHALLSKKSKIDDCVITALKLGSYVASKNGAIPDYDSEFFL